MGIKIKRVYEPADKSDGARILIDRLWPRGVCTATAKIDRWEKDLAPSDELRKWFGHDPARWAEFKKRYRTELKSQAQALDNVRRLARQQTVTLVFGARDAAHSNAAALLEWLKK